MVPPGSRVENRSAESIRLRARYRLNLLAIARQGNPFRERLREINFRAGNVVLLQGPVDVLEENVASLGFLPLLERGLDVGMKRMAFLPIIIFIFCYFFSRGAVGSCRSCIWRRGYPIAFIPLTANAVNLRKYRLARDYFIRGYDSCGGSFTKYGWDYSDCSFYFFVHERLPTVYHSGLSHDHYHDFI